MIPDLICAHYSTLPPYCEIGRVGGRDCSGCSAYADGSAYLGFSESDRARIQAWADLPRLPVAHIKGLQP
jgi:hypothetical protein